MSEERTPRKSTSRKVDERPTDTWKPASILPDPEPQDGYDIASWSIRQHSRF